MLFRKIFPIIVWIASSIFYTLSLFFFASPKIVSKGKMMQKNMNLRYKIATIEVFFPGIPVQKNRHRHIIAVFCATILHKRRHLYPNPLLFYLGRTLSKVVDSKSSAIEEILQLIYIKILKLSCLAQPSGKINGFSVIIQNLVFFHTKVN